MVKLNRRQFLGMAAAGACMNAGFGWAAETAAAPAVSTGKRPYNVLHIMSDDLCTRLGCYGWGVKSPNIDRLAQRGVRFERAYCQYPLCNPSRASYMTGLRPDTTKVITNQIHFRDTVRDAVTIPQSFQDAGYSVARVGKIYHYGVPRQIGTDGLDDPASWEKVVNPCGRDVDDISMVEVLRLGPDGKARTETGKRLQDTGATLSWLAAEGTDAEQTDGLGATAAVDMLEMYAKGAKPFYLAVGFYRPHTPFVAPKDYFGLYPRDRIEVPEVPPNLKDLFPAAALFRQKPQQVAMDTDLRKMAIQAYYASTTFMDAQVGRLLDALDRLGLAENTIVVFHSDHGYQLGERDLWQKMTLFEEAARVPMIISVPGNKANGRVCGRPVELVSLQKTLTDLAGVGEEAKAEGHSMRPLVNDPDAQWDYPAFTQVTHRKSKMGGLGVLAGRSVRTERWRYTEWNEGRDGAELYDHETDPREMKNLAEDAAYAERANKLKALLSAGGA